MHPMASSSAYADHGTRVNENAISSAGHSIDATVSRRMRDTRSPTAASPSAPASPPMPRKDSSSP